MRLCCDEELYPMSRMTDVAPVELEDVADELCMYIPKEMEMEQVECTRSGSPRPQMTVQLRNGSEQWAVQVEQRNGQPIILTGKLVERASPVNPLITKCPPSLWDDYIWKSGSLVRFRSTKDAVERLQRNTK